MIILILAATVAIVALAISIIEEGRTLAPKQKLERREFERRRVIYMNSAWDERRSGLERRSFARTGAQQ